MVKQFSYFHVANGGRNRDRAGTLSASCRLSEDFTAFQRFIEPKLVIKLRSPTRCNRTQHKSSLVKFFVDHAVHFRECPSVNFFVGHAVHFRECPSVTADLHHQTNGEKNPILVFRFPLRLQNERSNISSFHFLLSLSYLSPNTQ